MFSMKYVFNGFDSIAYEVCVEVFNKKQIEKIEKLADERNTSPIKIIERAVDEYLVRNRPASEYLK